MPGEDTLPAGIQPLAIWRRRKRAMWLAFSVALLLTIIAAFVWPPTYVSTATILIEQQEVPVDLVRSTISSFADQRIQTINQRVMTSEKLLGIVQTYDLYARQRKREGRERILERIRKDIHFGSIKASVIDPRQGRPVEATIAFSVGFSSRSPVTAARVANELSTLYLQENLKSRKQLAQEAVGFLTDEADRLDKRMDELQAQLAKFKEGHVNNLPEQASMNLQLVNRADDQKRDVETQINSLDQQIVYLEAQLAQVSRTSPVYASTGERVMASEDRLKYLRSEYARVSSLYAPGHPDVVRLKREIEGLASTTSDSSAENERQRQLQDAQTELAAARQRYAPEHPELQRLERLVAVLSDPAIATIGTETAAASNADNPAYIQLQAQLNAAKTQRAAMEQKRTEISAQISTLESRLANAPGVERDYVDLLRDLDGTQSKYSEVRQKQMEAQVAQNLETEHKGERFTLIDPPVAPDEPATPNRSLILVLGLVLSLAVAAGAAFALETVDRSVRGLRDVTGLLSVPPLAVIPWFETAGQIAARRRRHRYALVGSLAGFALLLVAVHEFYRPLDVLWAIAVRRLVG